MKIPDTLASVEHRHPQACRKVTPRYGFLPARTQPDGLRTPPDCRGRLRFAYTGNRNTYRDKILRCTSLLPPAMVPGRDM